MGRSIGLVTALLAGLKAGAAYLPVDPGYPAGRVGFMLADACPAVIVADAAGAAVLPGPEVLAAPVVVADDPGLVTELAGMDYAGLGDADRSSPLLPEHPAYVMYTSGSTGVPKGVTVSHRSVAGLLGAGRERFGFGGGEVWGWFHSFSFDVSVWEVFGALVHGGRLVVVPFGVSRSPGVLLGLLVREGRLVGWQARGGGGPVLVNMYGPTEATVYVTYGVVDPGGAAGGGGSVIGSP